MAQRLLERDQGQGLIGHAATIFALSSGRPPAGVAVVRMSGPRALAALDRIAAPRPPERAATLRTLIDPASGLALDATLVLWFAAPASATGEDVVELHLHGGVAVVAAVLAMLAKFEGLRLAEPGEFTRRGFDNGKIDLSRAEGLADLIAATTEPQRQAALAQAGGRLARVAENWRARLLAVLAAAEAELDFGESEEDVARAPGLAGGREIAGLARELAAAIADAPRGERLRDGLTVAVVGAPNVGKSSLVNALARRDVAIVSPHSGTTRDLIDVQLAFGGVAVTLIDTAGLRDAVDPVEQDGIARARVRATAADLVLEVSDSDGERHFAAAQPVRNMIDRSGQPPGLHDGTLYVSAATGAGLDVLEAWLGDWARAAVRPGEAVLVTQARHRDAMAQALAELDRVVDEPDAVLRTESLRLATRALGRITGRVDVEDVLDAIFARFCIGK